MATALRACATTRVTRACERNSALFAAVLANETFQQTLLDELDVDSLAHTAAACVAGRAAVEALGDEPWLEAIKAIERDLTHGAPACRSGRIQFQGGARGGRGCSRTRAGVVQEPLSKFRGHLAEQQLPRGVRERAPRHHEPRGKGTLLAALVNCFAALAPV